MSTNNSSSNKKVHRTVAVLKLPKTISLLITLVQGIVKALTGNPTFPTPNPPLSALSGAVNDLQVAETAALTRATGTIATRNEKRAALLTLLEVLRAYVQSIADASPENAISIIESAGLAVRKTTVHAPPTSGSSAPTRARPGSTCRRRCSRRRRSPACLRQRRSSSATARSSRAERRTGVRRSRCSCTEASSGGGSPRAPRVPRRLGGAVPSSPP